MAKFRTRRDEALRKLATTSQNLGRLEDLLDHLTRELSIMEETHQKSELKRKFLSRANALDLFVLDAERRSLMEKLRTVQTEIGRLESVGDVSIDAPVSEGTEIQRIRTDVRDLRLAFESAEDRFESVREKYSGLEKAAALAQQELRLLRQTGGDAAWEPEQSSVPIAGDISLQKLEQKIVEMGNRVRELENDIRAEHALHVERGKFLDEKEGESNALRDHIHHTRESADGDREKLAQAIARLGELRARENLYEKELIALGQYPGQIHHTNPPAELQKFPKLREKLKVPEPLRQAFEGMLRQTFDAYVIPDVTVLLEYVALSRQLGWGGFSAIAVSLPHKPKVEEAPRPPKVTGVVGWLHEQIPDQENVRTILLGLLGPVLLVEDLDVVRQFHQGIQSFPHPIVTRDGIVFMPSGEVYVAGGVVNAALGSVEKCREALEGIQEERRTAEQSVRALEVENATHTREMENDGKRLEHLLSEVHRLQSHLHSEGEGIARKENELTTLRGELRYFEEQKLARTRVHFQALAGEAEKLSVDLMALQESLQSAERDAREKKRAYLERTDALERAERAWMEHERELRARQEAITQARISQAKWQTELDAQTARALEQYNMRLEDWEKFQSPLSVSREAARRELAELRRQLQALGDVGEGSDALYMRLQDRHRFLEEGCQDIRRSDGVIREEILRLDEQAQTAFVEGIQKINEEFNRMFSVLFRGGEARLEMRDGIEILIKPPGRRWMPLTLLSGGERSLTAIALLFALFELRPSPFSLLDEVDAALDEANVGRFVNLIQDFAKNIQVLVVTHNRKTMEAAESLYGVTMEEAGVSKVVSLKLDAVPA